MIPSENHNILLPLGRAEEDICEGDILMFRVSSFKSWLISKFGGGIHSHVGLASRHGKCLECVEFREFMGGRTICLDVYLQQSDAIVDIFRPVPEYTYQYYDVKSESVKQEIR